MIAEDVCRCGHVAAAHEAGECWTSPDNAAHPVHRCECSWYAPRDPKPNVRWSATRPAPVWKDNGRWVTAEHGRVVELGVDADDDDELMPLQETGADFEQFHEKTAVTKVYGHWPPEAQQAYAGLGLASEAGEVAGKLKKLFRDADGRLDSVRQAEIIDECGDVLWYLARVLESVHADLWDAAEMNTAKVLRRVEDGTLHGDGDNR